jgi:hypothetical protein
MRRRHWCRLADHPDDALAKGIGGLDPVAACRDELAVIVDHLRSVTDRASVA